jgi:hypothetical protein
MGSASGVNLMRSPFLSAIVAGSLLLSATAAGAQQPGPIPARSGAEVEDAEQAVGILAIIGFATLLLLIGVFVFLDDDNNDVPSSP